MQFQCSNRVRASHAAKLLGVLQTTDSFGAFRADGLLLRVVPSPLGQRLGSTWAYQDREVRLPVQADIPNFSIVENNASTAIYPLLRSAVKQFVGPLVDEGFVRVLRKHSLKVGGKAAIRFGLVLPMQFWVLQDVNQGTLKLDQVFWISPNKALEALLKMVVLMP